MTTPRQLRREAQVLVMRSLLQMGVGPVLGVPLFVGPARGRMYLAPDGAGVVAMECVVSWQHGADTIGGLVAVPA